MPPTIALVGSFDRRGAIFLYARRLLQEVGLGVITINIGLEEPEFVPDVGSEAVAREAGKNLSTVLRHDSHARAHETLKVGLRTLVIRLYAQGQLQGILSLGGSADTDGATAAMQALPLGVPKLMVSTLTSGNVSQYVGISDVIMMPSVCNLSSVNRISRTIVRNAVMAMHGMVEQAATAPVQEISSKPIVAISMFGLTKPCADEARIYLESRGYEVILFNCTGTGGRTMEHYINEGYFVGVLDLTTTEWCDELVGGDMGAGPSRCDAAIASRVPQVVSVGATDMVNFRNISAVPVKYARRLLYRYTKAVTLMRTTAVECAKVGDILADKWNNAHNRMRVLLPLRGVSGIDAEGQVFCDPEARRAMFTAIEDRIYNNKVTVEELDLHINDKAFADHAAQALIDLIEAQQHP